MKRVLVAVDDTDAAHHVAEFVNRFFGDLDVEVLGINVAAGATTWVPPAIGWGGLYAWSYHTYTDPRVLDPDAVDVERKEAEREAMAVVHSSDLEHDETVVEFGDPAEAIERAANEREVDLIVVGSSDKNVLQRLLDPSVSRELVRDAARPVLVVH